MLIHRFFLVQKFTTVFPKQKGAHGNPGEAAKLMVKQGAVTFSPVTNSAPESCGHHADEAVNVPLGVEQMRRDANPPLAHAHDNIFFRNF